MYQANPGLNQTPRGECWTIFSHVVGVSERILLYGPPATGKTFQAIREAKAAGEAVFSFTLNPETSKSELLGKWIPKGGEFLWSDGLAIRAWRLSHERPVTIVWNEIDHASAEAVTALYAMLDDLDIAETTLDTGEVVRPGPYLKHIATMNGVPDDLLEGLRSRFPAPIRIDSVHPGAIASLPKDLQKAAEESCVHVDTARRIDFRSWKEFARLRSQLAEKIGPEKALEYAAKAAIPGRWLEFVNNYKITAK